MFSELRNKFIKIDLRPKQILLKCDIIFMSRALTIDFPLIEAAYTEEFGEIDTEIYEIAKTLWKTGA